MKLKRMIPYCEAQVKFDCTPEEAAERIFMCPGVEELKLYGRWEPESSTLLLTSASGGALRALLRPHVTGEYTGSLSSPSASIGPWRY